jgi:hypothetical protein
MSFRKRGVLAELIIRIGDKNGFNNIDKGFQSKPKSHTRVNEMEDMLCNVICLLTSAEQTQRFAEGN